MSKTKHMGKTASTREKGSTQNNSILIPTSESAGFYLTDAVEQNKCFPETFQIPPKKSIQAIRSSYLVKLIFNGENCPIAERMWVMVLEIYEDLYVGALHEESWTLEDMCPGNVVFFHSKHIIDIAPKDVWITWDPSRFNMKWQDHIEEIMNGLEFIKEQ